MFVVGIQCSREVVLTPCSSQPTRTSAVIVATEERESLLYMRWRRGGSVVSAHFSWAVLKLQHKLHFTCISLQVLCATCPFIWDSSIVFITRKPNVIWRQNLDQLTSLTELQKALEAHGCEPWVTKLLIIPHALRVRILWIALLFAVLYTHCSPSKQVLHFHHSLRKWHHNTIPVTMQVLRGGWQFAALKIFSLPLSFGEFSLESFSLKIKSKYM